MLDNGSTLEPHPTYGPVYCICSCGWVTFDYDPRSSDHTHSEMCEEPTAARYSVSADEVILIPTAFEGLAAF